MTRVKKGREYYGNILTVRAVEDCIRVTKKYTEGIWTRREVHPIQGEDFPNRLLLKYYEVHPDMEISWDMPMDWDMPASKLFDWLWREIKRETPYLEVLFRYDYRVNQASVLIKDGDGAVRQLVKSIPRFGEALRAVNGTK